MWQWTRFSFYKGGILMNNRKNILIILIVLIVSVLLMGCTSRVEEKVGTSIGEKVVEKTTGGQDVEIDSENENVSVETEDGSFTAGENIQWPADKMGELQDPGVKINSITELDKIDTTSVSMEVEDMDFAQEYLQNVKDLGYVEGSVEENNSSFSYILYKEDSIQATMSYLDTYKTMTIMYSENSDQAREFFE